MLTGKYMLLIIKANIVVITHVIAYLSHTYGMQISKRLWGWALQTWTSKKAPKMPYSNHPELMINEII